MSWGNIYDVENGEDSFWPSFTDIMMVIVMTFLLVTVAVVMSNTRLLDELKSSLVAEEQASQLAEFTLQENATLEEQLEYFQQRTSSLEMELLRSRARDEETRNQLAKTMAEVSRLEDLQLSQERTIERRERELVTVRQDLQQQVRTVSDLQGHLSQTQQLLTAERNRLQGELTQAKEQLTQESNRLQGELDTAKQNLNTETSRLQSELASAQKELAASQEEIQNSEQALAELREQTAAESLKLASLEGEYAELDKKYQKLVKPTRSSKGKTVVDVMYRKSGYRIRPPGAGDYRNVSFATMNAELSALKAEHGTNLYVKIIIPENSGLSYNQAWLFTRDTLNKYDYYYQKDESRLADDEDEAVQ
ncbi:MAG: hypothetical protein ACPGSM_04865 [Thiolinea sp.]